MAEGSVRQRWPVVRAEPGPWELPRILSATSDAHAVCEKLDFTALPEPDMCLLYGDR